MRLFRLGWLWLLVQLIQGQPLPLPQRLVPEAWPDIPEQTGPIERRLRVDLREGDLRHHRVLRERRRAHEVTDRLTAAGKACRAVREVSLVLLLADREAEVRAVVVTVLAFAALW